MVEPRRQLTLRRKPARFRARYHFRSAGAVNLRAADYGETHPGKNYSAIRFEDLCEMLIEVTARVMRFPAPLVAALRDVGSVAPRNFGYLKQRGFRKFRLCNEAFPFDI
jgi:hypothetical protein